MSFANGGVAAELRSGEPAAPDLLIAETLNAFWKLGRAGPGAPPPTDVLAVLDAIRLVPSRELAAKAAEFAERFDHPVYDCLYLALAEAEADVLLTADKRLLTKVTDRALRRRIQLITGR